MNLMTSRLYIRKLQKEDWLGLRQIAINHRKSKYAIYDRPLPIDEKEIKSLVDDFIAHGLFFVVFLKDNSNMIGYVCFQNRNDYYDIAYCFHSDYQHQGYAYESCLTLMNLLMETFQIKCFTASAALDNLPSCRLLKKMNFELESTEQIKSSKSGKDTDLFFELGKFKKYCE